jgi:hypothetical protein
MTRKKRETNRKNAQNSTGPRTKAGKLAIRLNALKHGILVKEVIGSGAILGESPKDFESLLSGLAEVYKPIGRAEELAVEEIAVSYIRRARALRAERVEIESAQREQELETIESLPIVSLALEHPMSVSAKMDILRSPAGTRWLSAGCEYCLQQLELPKPIEESTKDWLESIDCIMGTSLLKYINTPNPDRVSLAKRLFYYKSELESSAEAMDESQNQRMLGKSLPPSWVLERTMRYESLLDRQMMRAVQWLELLQERRGREEDSQNAKETPIK